MTANSFEKQRLDDILIADFPPPPLAEGLKTCSPAYFQLLVDKYPNSQVHLCETIGIGRRTLQNYLSGNTPVPFPVQYTLEMALYIEEKRERFKRPKIVEDEGFLALLKDSENPNLLREGSDYDLKLCLFGDRNPAEEELLGALAYGYINQAFAVLTLQEDMRRGGIYWEDAVEAKVESLLEDMLEEREPDIRYIEHIFPSSNATNENGRTMDIVLEVDGHRCELTLLDDKDSRISFWSWGDSLDHWFSAPVKFSESQRDAILEKASEIADEKAEDEDYWRYFKLRFIDGEVIKLDTLAQVAAYLERTFPNAVAYFNDGSEWSPDDENAENLEVKIWATEAESENDDGANAIATLEYIRA